jgi:hypothetical protein
MRVTVDLGLTDEQATAVEWLERHRDREVELVLSPGGNDPLKAGRYGLHAAGRLCYRLNQHSDAYEVRWTIEVGLRGHGPDAAYATFILGDNPSEISVDEDAVTLDHSVAPPASDRWSALRAVGVDDSYTLSLRARPSAARNDDRSFEVADDTAPF